MAWLALQLCLAAVFGLAFWSHARQQDRFREVLAGLRLPSSPRAARVITALDLVIAIALLVVPAIGAVAALAYLTVVTSVLAWRRAGGATIEDCGCSARAKPVTAAFFARNAMFAAAAVVLVARPDLGAAGAAAVTLPIALLAGGDLVPQRRVRAEVENAGVEDDSRRRILTMAAATAGAVASLPVLPAMARQGTVWGVGRKSKSSLRVQTLGKGLTQPEVQAAMNRSEIATLSRLPHAPVLAWDQAEVIAETFDSRKYTVKTRLVIAPLRRADGTLEGFVYVQKGESHARESLPGPIEFEERVQVETISDPRLLLIERDGSWTWEEPTPTPRRQQPSGDASVASDICTELWAAATAVENLLGCQNRVYRVACPRPNCFCYKKRCCTTYDPCDCTGSCRVCCWHCDNDCGTFDCCEQAGVNCSLC